VDLIEAFCQTEQAELEDLVGHAVDNVEDGLRQLDDALEAELLPASDLDVLRFLTHRADRQCALMRPAMGPMADGRFSPIE
jgi:hypothetical protein